MSVESLAVGLSYLLVGVTLLWIVFRFLTEEKGQPL